MFKRISILLFLALSIGLAIPMARPFFKARCPDVFHPSGLAECRDEYEPFDFPKLNHIVEKPLSYIGHGSQSIAFSSADGQWVVKFFLKKPITGKKKYRIHSPLRLIPWVRRAKERTKMQDREERLAGTLQRYELVFADLHDETALEALHFHHTSDLPLCRAVDGQGNEWSLDLNRLLFVVQRRVDRFIDRMASIQTAEEARAVVSAFDALLQKRARLGFYDARGSLCLGKPDGNYGFLQDRVVQFDPGRLNFSEEIKQNPAPEFEKMRERMRYHMRESFGWSLD